MCTVTIVTARRSASGESDRDSKTDGERVVRMVCNRDELRTRPAALPPVRRLCGDVPAVMPVDPVSNGTWIGANAAGLVITLLNVYRGSPSLSTRPVDRELRSRGEIIPALLSHPRFEGALRAAEETNPRDYPPFRLVIADSHQAVDLLSDGRSIESRVARIDEGPVFFTSSGLGDELVEPPRRELFERMFRDRNDPFQVQDEFHGHFWPDKLHLSVAMTRAEARTVSRTTVEMFQSRMRMSYTAIEAEGAGPRREIQIDRLRAELCH